MENKIIEKNLNISISLGIAVSAITMFFWLQSEPTAKVELKQGVISQKTTEKPAIPIIKSTIPATAPKNIHLVLKLRMRQLYVYSGDNLQASYPVAIGKPGLETPVGKFKVIEMLKNPDWTHPQTGKLVLPGPNNPLGERWIAFWNSGREYIGFHGTPDRASVGKAVSHGCVRMYNEHVRELYELVKMGTPVVVEN
ncbi:L,D-transpeptidase [Calothrix sp. FACHB-1219]|uniref:L,D-transpeptidase n=1 Tax=unclassified Calothrix TaxID=2619626 RepID=UPI00168577C9|nr:MULTISPECIES: L,D-transpeptidase [unclassified Calothrix]MBD2203483.1 L,D-transpeptidase [Calothrix sp. FACHB-168]MBD2219075.1 L,D-transpeptidase [Calothrix sp. FACHB-1219]